MARPSLLDRFRPVGAPGEAGRVGVPADSDHRADELGAVFAALADTIAEATERVGRARREADSEVATARQWADEVLGAARLSLGPERAAATHAVRTDAERRSAEMLRAARDEAEAVHDQGVERVGPLVAEALARLIALLDGTASPAPQVGPDPAEGPDTSAAPMRGPR